MSLNKAIKYGKEKRKIYYGAKSIDPSCRNHGSDDWSKDDRMIQRTKDDIKMKTELNDYIKCN